MKYTKLTMAALALIAAAALATSAKAASGDVLLGIYDANTGSTSVAESYEVDLGSFSSLTYGETFNLGSTISTLYSSDTSASLEFDIAAAPGAFAGGGLAAKEVALTASTLPPLTGSNVSPYTAISTEVNTFTGAGNTALGAGLSTTGTAFTEEAVSNSLSGSFKSEVSGSYEYGGGTLAVILTPYTTLASADFYTVLNKTTGGETATPDGEFVFGLSSGLTTLTFEPLQVNVPEPSTYALGAGGLLLLVVLMRRRSSVA